jgi:hypothetical protein
MHVIVLQADCPPDFEPTMGDLYVKKGDPHYANHLFMLCCPDIGQWSAVSLDSGKTWNGLAKTAADAVKGLTFFRRDATITIS